MMTDIDRARLKRDAQALPAQYPHLIPVNGGNSRTTAAKNIRIELKRKWPQVKFSVRSETFSMGDAIRISWTDGPTGKQVDAIVNKYEAGSFDGMQDLYTYNTTAWTETFGDAKCVTTSREISLDVKRYAVQQIAKHWGIENPPTVEWHQEYGGYSKLSDDPHVKNADEWLSTLMHRFTHNLEITATNSEGFFCRHIPRDYDLEYEQREAWPPSAINY